MAEKHGWGRLRSDALFLEWYLKKQKLVQKELNWRHDFIYNNMKIDVKEVNGKWFNIHHGKMNQYKESIELKELTHFFFYKSSRNNQIPLKVGDNIDIYPIAICDAKQIWKAALSSDKEKTEAFVPVETIKILGEDNERIYKDLARMCGNSE